jgi:hypothetical protein
MDNAVSAAALSADALGPIDASIALRAEVLMVVEVNADRKGGAHTFWPHSQQLLEIRGCDLVSQSCSHNRMRLIQRRRDSSTTPKRTSNKRCIHIGARTRGGQRGKPAQLMPYHLDDAPYVDESFLSMHS